MPTYCYIPIFFSQVKFCCCCRCCRCYSPLAHMKTTIQTSQPKMSCQPPRNIVWCCKHQGTSRIDAAQAELFVMVTTEPRIQGSAAWAVALKSGRRPQRPLARALAGGLRLVTEGYSGVPPLPPTSRGVTSGSPRAHLPRCNLQCILLMGSKKHRVLRCFGPFGVSDFHLGAIKKPRVLRGFGVQGGPRNGKNDMLKVF